VGVKKFPERASAALTVTWGFMPLISAPELTRFTEEILVAAGVPPHKAAITAASVVASNLRGVDSHGIQLYIRA